MAGQTSNSSKPEPKDFAEIWRAALQTYKKQTGYELPTAIDFPSKPRDADEVIQYIDRQGEAFQSFRAKGEKIRRALRPLVDIVLPFIDAGAEGAANVAPGGKAVFVAIGVLLKATKGVSGLYDVIETLLEKFNMYFQRLQIHLEPSTRPPDLLVKIFVDTLVQVLVTLAVVTKHCNIVESDHPFQRIARVTLRRTKDYIGVIMDKSDVKDALYKFEELAKAELLATAAQANAIVRSVQPRLQVMYDATVINELRTWINAPNPQPLNYESKRMVGSCQWFLDDRFEEWKMRENGMYWIHGRAASGKSVLFSSIVDALKHDTALLLAYFYFDVNDPQKQDCRALVSSLVSQIGTKFDDGIRYLEGERRRVPEQPVYEELLAMLSRLLGLSGSTFVVIDALDECPELVRNSGLLNFIKHLSDVQSEAGVDLRVLVASRPEPDIMVCMPNLATHTLDFSNAIQHKEDIRDYISAQLSDQAIASFSAWPDTTKERVQSVLMERSNGIFLWVKLQLQYLQHCTSDDAFRAIDELPSDLNETYERILKNFRASKVSIDRIRHVFECVAFAGLPLSSAQVVEIFFMSFPSSPEASITLNSDSDIDNPAIFLLQNCPGILEIVSAPVGHMDCVQFIHLSVKEYLTSEKLEQASAESARLYRIRDRDANCTLAQICLTALDLNNPLGTFRGYADSCWSLHITCSIYEAIAEPLFRFLHPCSPSFVRWAEDNAGLPLATQGTALHCTASLGLCHHTKRLLEDIQSAPSQNLAPLLRERNKYGGTALHSAMYGKSSEVTAALLSHGALVSDADNDGRIPLHIAASKVALEHVRVLLGHLGIGGRNEAMLQCRSRDYEMKTALHHAASHGQIDICRLLLEGGSLIDDVDQYGNTPLHNAAMSTNVNLVRILLEFSVTEGSGMATTRLCRVRDFNGNTALHDAARSRNKESADICRVLLEYGSIVDDRDNAGNTVLHVASQGQVEVVQLLLRHSVMGEAHSVVLQSHPRNFSGCTVLHSAAGSDSPGAAEILRTLLEHGASIDDTDDDDKTVLHCAAAAGSEDTVRSILNYLSAHRSQAAVLELCRFRSRDGATALHLAARMYTDPANVCRILLEYDASIDEADNQGNTPLHHAARAGNLNIVQVLIDHCSRTDRSDAFHLCRIRNYRRETALHSATMGYNSNAADVSRVLLEYGAPVDIGDIDGNTPLHCAALAGNHSSLEAMLDYPLPADESNITPRCRLRNRCGQTVLLCAVSVSTPMPDTCRSLLKYGSLLDDTDDSGNTALHLASESGMPIIVRLLLEYAALNNTNWNAVDLCRARNQRGETALHIASGRNFSDAADVCHILLEYGASVNDYDERGNSPLHRAAAVGNSSAVRILLNSLPIGSSNTPHPCRAVNLFGETALHLAAGSRSQEKNDICRILLGYGAFVDATDHVGNTPLHRAAAAGNLYTVRLLLEFPGPSSNPAAVHLCRARNRRGETALQALDNDRQPPSVGTADTRRLLLEYEALLDDADKDEDRNVPSQTAMHYTTAGYMGMYGPRYETVSRPPRFYPRFPPPRYVRPYY